MLITAHSWTIIRTKADSINASIICIQSRNNLAKMFCKWRILERFISSIYTYLTPILCIYKHQKCLLLHCYLLFSTHYTKYHHCYCYFFKHFLLLQNVKLKFCTLKCKKIYGFLYASVLFLTTFLCPCGECQNLEK